MEVVDVVAYQVHRVCTVAVALCARRSFSCGAVVGIEVYNVEGVCDRADGVEGFSCFGVASRGGGALSVDHGHEDGLGVDGGIDDNVGEVG